MGKSPDPGLHWASVQQCQGEQCNIFMDKEVLQTDPGSWCLEDPCLLWVLSSHQTPGEVTIGCGMTGQQIWAAQSFQHCHNRRAMME